MQSPTSRTTSLFAIVASAVYGTIVATGVLAIGFVAVAAVKGYSPVDFYAETFPSFRGPGVTQIPPVVYAIFFLYVIGAVEVALVYRRRLSNRWSRRGERH